MVCLSSESFPHGQLACLSPLRNASQPGLNTFKINTCETLVPTSFKINTYKAYRG